jgi:hypothetical protein
MMESAFDVVVESVVNDAALIESSVVWRYIGVPCALRAMLGSNPCAKRYVQRQ